MSSDESVFYIKILLEMQFIQIKSFTEKKAYNISLRELLTLSIIFCILLVLIAKIIIWDQAR